LSPNKAFRCSPVAGQVAVNAMYGPRVTSAEHSLLADPSDLPVLVLAYLQSDVLGSSTGAVCADAPVHSPTR
jgi:hypothetical protein